MTLIAPCRLTAYRFKLIDPTRNRPMCEVRHPRRRDEPSHRQHLQPAHHHVEQRTEDARTLLVDFSEQLPFRRVAEYVFQLEDDGAILEVGARHDVADSLKSNRTRSAEQRFVKILEQRPDA
jgi:hypothetical protein